MSSVSVKPEISRALTRVSSPDNLVGSGRFRLQITRFAIVGLTNVALDLLLLNIAIHLTHTTRGPLVLIFASLSFLTAVVNSYYWNGRWTFQVPLRWKFQLLSFVGTNCVGLAITDTVIYFLLTLPHPWIGTSAMLHVNEAKIVAVGITAAWNFCVCRCFIFRATG